MQTDLAPRYAALGYEVFGFYSQDCYSGNRLLLGNPIPICPSGSRSDRIEGVRAQSLSR